MASCLCQAAAASAALSTQSLLSQDPPSLAVRAPSGNGLLPFSRLRSSRRLPARPSRSPVLRLRSAVTEEKEGKQEVRPAADDPDAVTRKWGLEAGLWKVFTSKKEVGEAPTGKGSKAKDLLARYGSAYLITSISLSLVSFTLCYLLVDNGVDVPALLSQVGIQLDETGGKVGTFALAYAAHKAASPIRFPPTVALTPIIAQWVGKKEKNDGPKDP